MSYDLEDYEDVADGVDYVEQIKSRLHNALKHSLRVLVDITTLDVRNSNDGIFIGRTTPKGKSAPKGVYHDWYLFFDRAQGKTNAFVRGFFNTDKSRSNPIESVVKVITPDITHLEMIVVSFLRPKVQLSVKTAPKQETSRLMWLHGFGSKGRFFSRAELRAAIDDAEEGKTPTTLKNSNIRNREFLVLAYGEDKELVFETGVYFFLNQQGNEIVIPYAKPFGYWFEVSPPKEHLEELLAQFPQYSSVI